MSKKEANTRKMNLANLTLEELDLLYKTADSDSPQKEEIGKEIDRRVVSRAKEKSKLSKAYSSLGL